MDLLVNEGVLEGQAVSDVSREVVGMRAGSTDLFLLLSLREMAIKTQEEDG